MFNYKILLSFSSFTMNTSTVSTLSDAQEFASHLRKLVYNQEYFLVEMFKLKLTEMTEGAIKGKTEYCLRQVDADRYTKIVAYLKEKPFLPENIGRFEVRDIEIPHYKLGYGDECTDEVDYIQHRYELWFVLN